MNDRWGLPQDGDFAAIIADFNVFRRNASDCRDDSVHGARVQPEIRWIPEDLVVDRLVEILEAACSVELHHRQGIVTEQGQIGTDLMPCSKRDACAQ